MSKPMPPTLPWLQPDWPAPESVVAGCTTRRGGVSEAPWDHLNLGDHVNDVETSVQENRRLLQQQVHQLGGGRLVYVRQIHGVDVLELDSADLPEQAVQGVNQLADQTTQTADGTITQDRGVALIMVVADCLAILLADRDGRTVAALHAGWRGLAGAGQADGQTVVSQAMAAFARKGIDPADLMAWLGPCIGPDAFEVGEDVWQAFTQPKTKTKTKTKTETFNESALILQAASCFVPAPAEKQPHGEICSKWRADLAGLARLALTQAGVKAVYGNDSSPAWCTVAQADLFFSHRRDAARLGASGRFGAFIGLRR